jgi:hypothetical protein
LILYVLIFVALITLGLGTSLLVITWKDPSRLMLGQVSAREHAALRYIRQGDNLSGELVERLLEIPVGGSSVVDQTRQLDEGSSTTEEHSNEGET